MNRFLLPIALGQAAWLKATLKPALPPTGESAGIVGTGAAVRMAVIGDSTAASYGVATHNEGFAANLARTIAERAEVAVEYESIGRYGATARRVRHRMTRELERDLDTVVLLAGGNDVLARRTASQWHDDLAAVVDVLGDHARQVLVSGIPRFSNSPAFPRLFARIVDERADMFNAIARQTCARRANTLWVACPDPVQSHFARDGLHPNGYGYRRWAEAVAGQFSIPGPRWPTP